MILSVVIVVLCCLYALFILWCRYGWTKARKPAHHNSLIHSVAVIVAVRNEEATIDRLLDSLSAQQFPKKNFEIIIVDDHSVDHTAEKVNSFIERNNALNIRLLKSEGVGKKMAIDQGIRQSQSELVLTTDADCFMGKEWIGRMTHPFSDDKIQFVAGPVVLTGATTLFTLIQKIEMIGLVGITGGSMNLQRPMMCNGANLCYRRAAYLEVNGFDGNAFASGDDTQLMKKLSAKDPSSLYYLNDLSALVKSDVQRTFTGFWQQRRRWATKIPLTLSFFTVTIAILAWLVHAGLVISLISLLFNDHELPFLIASFLIKSVPEIIFLNKVSTDFQLRQRTIVVLLAQPFYWLYITLIGAAVPFSKYEWKGRKVS
jgi:cellulose synthase/poly-beta-1,6-N-acetylglucosamine synthase-like glycosyltransferase